MPRALEIFIPGFLARSNMRCNQRSRRFAIDPGLAARPTAWIVNFD
jgi:hypothetical protein